MPSMTLSEELQWRGFINQTTFKDIKELDKEKLTFYHGFDASADSQTVGNLAAMMFDMVFMRHGYAAIIVAGGATSLIGDPGGKDEERSLQSQETIAHNVERAKLQITKIFGDHEFTLVNNLDWTKDMSVIEFLRDIGKNFSVTPLIQRDYIAKRLGEGGAGISYTEFSYSLLQAMDYLYLFDKYKCTLQLGGSDQWSNCLSGVELIRKARGDVVNVITQPLIMNKSSGKKFGKSEDGAVWLDADKTSIYKFYQFWLGCDDGGVEDYLKIYTSLTKDEIDTLIADFNNNKSGRSAQKKLAFEVTKLVHGQDQADKQVRIVSALFGETSVAELGDSEMATIREEVPNVTITAGDTLVDVLVSTGLATSNSEARRLQAAGAVYVNNQPLNKDRLEAGDFKNGRLLIRRGKAFKDSALVELKS